MASSKGDTLSLFEPKSRGHRLPYTVALVVTKAARTSETRQPTRTPPGSQIALESVSTARCGSAGVPRPQRLLGGRRENEDECVSALIALSQSLMHRLDRIVARSSDRAYYFLGFPFSSSPIFNHASRCTSSKRSSASLIQ